MIVARAFRACVIALVVLSCTPIEGKSTAGGQGARFRRPQPGEAFRTLLHSGTRVQLFEPRKWNGTVLMQTFGQDGSVSDSTLLIFLSRGYAVVKVSEQMAFWDLSEKLADLESVRRDLTAIYGEYASVYLFGHSAGGYRVLAAMERNPNAYRGGVAFCAAALTKHDSFDLAADILVAFDHFFPNVLTSSGRTLAAVQVNERTPMKVALALESAPQREAELARVFRLKREDVASTVLYYAYVLRDLQRGAGGNPFDMANHQFSGFDDDSAFNHKVRRIVADSAAARALRERFYALTGRLSTPTIIVNNSYDALMLPRAVEEYSRIAEKAGDGHWLLVDDVSREGHCNYSAGQMVEAIDRVIGWAETGDKPRRATLAGKPLVYPKYEELATSEIDGTWRLVEVVSNGQPSTTASRQTPSHHVNILKNGVWSKTLNGELAGREGVTVTAPGKFEEYDHFGQRWLLIYEIRGDELRMAHFKDNDRAFVERPRDFTQSGLLVRVFARVRGNTSDSGDASAKQRRTKR